jgi:serine/threonine protein kinase
MYEMLTGKPAFAADNLSRVVIRVGSPVGDLMIAISNNNTLHHYTTLFTIANTYRKQVPPNSHDVHDHCLCSLHQVIRGNYDPLPDHFSQELRDVIGLMLCKTVKKRPEVCMSQGAIAVAAGTRGGAQPCVLTSTAVSTASGP